MLLYHQVCRAIPLFCIACVFMTQTTMAQTTRALMIAVPECDHSDISPLPLTRNDVMRLATTMRERNEGVEIRVFGDDVAKKPATTKLLVLDTFSLDEPSTGNRVASDSFKGIGSFYLMASSGMGFYGHFWKDREMSLFAYWFVEAMRGSADRSLDGNVSQSELNSYLTMSIENLSNAMGMSQKIFAWQLKSSACRYAVFRSAIRRHFEIDL